MWRKISRRPNPVRVRTGFIMYTTLCRGASGQTLTNQPALYAGMKRILDTAGYLMRTSIHVIIQSQLRDSCNQDSNTTHIVPAYEG